MASAQFLEEALNTDVDESAVNALVGSLETQLVPASSAESTTEGNVVQNHVINNISNGGIVVQKHGVSNEESEGSVSNAVGVVSDANSNTKQTLVRSTSLAHSTVVNTVVTSLSGLPITQIGPNVITKSSEGVKIVTYPAGSQLGTPQVVNINNRSFPQTITLPNGSIPSSVISSVPSNVQTIVTNSTLGKPLPGTIGVIKVEQGQSSGATLVLKAPGSGPMTAGSMTLTQGTAGTTAAPGNVTLGKPIMTGQPVANAVRIVNMNAVRPGTPVQGQKGLAQQQILINSQSMIRPGAPGQPAQITLSNIPGLQAGGGTILIKNEQGQLQLIRIGPSPTATTGTPSGTITTNNAAPHFRLQQLPVQQGTGSAVVVAATTAAQQVSQPPGLTTTAPKQQVDTTKEKCRKFLANLLELSSREPKAVERNVRTLIQELIDAKVEPEEFCDRLEKLLNASPQPCLIGFLKKSLPLLRQSLFSREMTIEGIRPPPQQVVLNVVNTPSTIAQVPQLQTQLRPQMVTQTVRVVAPLNAAGQNISVTTNRMGQLQNRFVTPIRGQITTPGKIITTALRGQAPLATSTQPPPLHHTTPISQTPTSPPVHTIRAAAPNRTPTPKNQANKAPLKQIVTKNAIQNKANASNLKNVVISKPSTITVANKSISKVVSKVGYEESKFGASGFGGDDDINDVAAMGGVNLAEESQRILGSTQFVGTQIRSVKDEIFLHSIPLQNKIRQIVSKHGLDEPSSEVASLISHACQERLKTLLEKLACIAEHRIDVIKLDSRYEVTQDVKGQLKFLEELDRVERKRHEEQERELLLRAAKSRSKSEDPEQVKLKAKAKEMQRAEMEELRQREANLTALQAIGPRKKPRLDAPGSSDSPATGAGSSTIFGRPQLPLRPRLKRVNLKDLLFLLEQEKETSRTNLLYKAYLK